MNLLLDAHALIETQRGEQHGFMNLLKSLHGTIRNPLANDPKVEWT